MSLLITFLAGVSSLIGALIVYRFKNSHSLEQFSIAVALGALLSLLVADLLPEFWETVTGERIVIPILFLATGFMILRILDHYIPEHEDTGVNHDSGNAVHVGLISALALIIHNIIEGMTIYSVSYNSLREGLILAVGVSLHNIPIGMLVFSTTKNIPRSKRLLVFCAVVLSTFAGGILAALFANTERAEIILVPLAIGMICYITFMELLPHVLRDRKRLLSLVGVLTGFLCVLLSMLLEKIC